MVDSSVEPKEVLKRYHVIAVVGASQNPEKDAHTVPQYLKDHGYTVIPVNPTAKEIFGEKAYPSLSQLPEEVARKVEVVDVFRPSAELPQIAREVVELRKKYGKPYVFWSQLGLLSDEAKKILFENHVDYVMDACMRIVHSLYLAHAQKEG
ncbi:MAG: CoA-binding protein [Thermoprotei archaeon]